jgi:acyl dehydratase
MPLDSSLVGTSVGSLVADVDARWTMAYAAGLDDLDPCYLDTRREGGVVAHPLFPVCFEWPVALAARAKLRVSLTSAEAARGVHATHHAVLHRAIRPPERLATTATPIGIEQRRPGAYETIRFETVDERGAPVTTTYYGSLYREVELIGPDRPAAVPCVPQPRAVSSTPRAEFSIPISAGAAHVYTECARIWNPIHTDSAVAEKAGLPGLILHGTATLALALSRIVASEAGGDPERIAQVSGRFAGMVLMPSSVMLRIIAREKINGIDAVHFEVLSGDGGRAIRDGVVMLRG